MRNEVYDRLRRKNVTIPRATFDADSSLVNRLVGDQIAQYVFGPQAAFVRSVNRDPDIATALRLLSKVRTPQELLRRAQGPER
jgi:hypothetical protein